MSLKKDRKKKENREKRQTFKHAQRYTIHIHWGKEKHKAKYRQKDTREKNERREWEKCPLGDEDQIYRKLNYMNNIILVNKNQDLK